MYKKLLIVLAFLALFIPFSAFSWGTMEDSQWEAYFDNWNTDNNDYLDENEFRTGFSQANLFGMLDGDSDGSLGMSEFNAIAYDIFECWETTQDGQIGPTEWLETPLTRERALEWDENGNGLISREEFSSGLYEAMDTNENGTLQPDEVVTGMFQLLDTMENNQISRMEFASCETGSYAF